MQVVLILAATVSAVPATTPAQPSGASVQVAATAEVLRAARVGPDAEPGEVARRVTRSRRDGAVLIAFD
jgi:hypothetical protein